MYIAYLGAGQDRLRKWWNMWGVYCNVNSIFRGWSRSSKQMVEHVGNGRKVEIDNEMKK